MRTKTLIAAGCLSTVVLMAGCERKPEPTPAATNGPAATQTTPAASSLGPPSMPPGKQKNLTCQTGWEEFCGGWTVVDMTIDPGGNPLEHLGQGERFVIGQKNSKMYLFPRDALIDLWNDKKVELTPIEVDGKCLVGKIKLEHGGADAWHRITLTAGSAAAEVEIGDEIVLNVGFNAQEASTPWPPTSCLIPVGGGVELDHGGLAHAED